MISNLKVRLKPKLMALWNLSALINCCFALSTFYLPEVVVTRDIFYSPYYHVNCWNSSDKYNCPITSKNIRFCSAKVECYINSLLAKFLISKFYWPVANYIISEKFLIRTVNSLGGSFFHYVSSQTRVTDFPYLWACPLGHQGMEQDYFLF